MDNARIEELFETLGQISIRKLFGGKGIYCDSVIVAVVVRGELMLKGDGEIAAEYEAAGGRHWTYVNKRHGREVAMPYWTAPESALDDPEEMAAWARKAYEAGLRSEK